MNIEIKYQIQDLLLFPLQGIICKVSITVDGWVLQVAVCSGFPLPINCFFYDHPSVGDFLYRWKDLILFPIPGLIPRFLYFLCIFSPRHYTRKYIELFSKFFSYYEQWKVSLLCHEEWRLPSKDWSILEPIWQPSKIMYGPMDILFYSTSKKDIRLVQTSAYKI